LPPDEDNRILTRELVYTAISRARRSTWAPRRLATRHRSLPIAL